MEHAELIEWIAFEQLEGPTGDRRAEAYMAAAMAQRNNLARSSRSKPAKKPADFLMFREQGPADVASELAKAGIFQRKQDG